MAPFRAPGQGEFTGTQFRPAAEDSYLCSIDRYKIIENVVTQYNKEGNPRVQFFLTPLAIADDEDALMVDDEDNELPEDKQFIFFFDPDHLGFEPRLAKSRKFLASALQIPVDQPLEAESLEDFCESLLGKEIICDVIIKQSAKGPINNITDTRQVKQRKARRARVEKESLVEEAEKVFDESDGNEDDF